MKKYGFVILLLCLVGFFFVPVFGQIGMPSHSIVNPDSVSHNFYEREIVKGNTITYKVDYSLGSLYQISNSNNTRVGQLMSLKNGSTPTEPLNSSLEIVSLEPVYRAFLETFTPEEIRALARNNASLNVGYAINENGTVLEVRFTMLRDRPHLYNIPPQYLEKLEIQLKSTVSFIIPSHMQYLREYKFITVSQDISFSWLESKL